MIAGVYSIFNTTNGKNYVGSSIRIEKRWIEHKTDLDRGTHFNPHLQNAWNKYGSNLFEYKILEKCENTSREILLSREDFWIQKLDSHVSKNGYNICQHPRGGKLGTKATPKTLLRMSKSMSGKNHPMWGKHLKPETIEKVRMLQIGVPKPTSGKRKRVTLKSPSGKIVEIYGLRKFCRENNLKPGGMWLVSVGKQSEYKGWTKRI